MSMRTLRCLAPVFVLAFSLAVAPASAKRLDGVFTEVKEAGVVVLDYGDGSYDIRIFGVEPPAEGQPFAIEAKEFVRERVLGMKGGIRFKYRNEGGEMVSRVFYRPGGNPALAERDLAIDLVAAGLAWTRPGEHYRPINEGEVDPMTATLKEAQAAHRGIWSTNEPVEPWVYRGKNLPVEAVPSGRTEGTVGNLDRNMSKRSGDDNECAIAKNPNNAQQLVTHCNSLTTPWRSTDGGQTWVIGGTIGSYCCDPNLAWDKFGNLYATFINGALNGIVTKLSTDGGVIWNDLASFNASGVDQPSVVATERADGNVSLWIVWNQGGMVARGALVTGLGVANVGPFGAMETIATGGSCSFGDLSVSPIAPYAAVQVCGPQSGQTGGNVVINVDADGLGAGLFGPAIIPTTTNVGGFDFIPAQNSRSIDSETGLVFDRNPASPHYGRLFLIYTDEPVQENSDTNIYVRHSDDTGSTWSAPTLVSVDAANRSQFLPKIAADPATGNIAICWHDTRNSATNRAMEIYCDTTTPTTYPAFVGNVPVSDGASTSNGAGVEFGDYSGLTVSGGTAHPTWADSSNSTGDNPQGTTNFDAYTDALPVLAADYTLGATPPSQSVCAPTNGVFTVNVGAFGGYTDPVTLSASGQPAGTTATFTPDNLVTPVGSRTLTIGNTAGGTPGTATITVSATSTTGAKGVQLTMKLATAVPGQPSLASPADGVLNVPVPAPLSWGAPSQAGTYSVQIATDAAFTTIVEQASGLLNPAYSASTINTNTVYYWRVQATNGCGDSSLSNVFSFRTAAAPGDCSSGTVANILYQYGFEAGASGWTHSGTGDSWAISTTNPHSGTSLFHANDPTIVSDQRLVSPSVVLPSGQNPVVIKFWHVPVMETNSPGCWDGGIVEVSTNAGGSWTQVPAGSILLGPYTGALSSSANPLSGLQAWCGTSTAYMQTIADVSAFAGQTAQFRLRLGSDASQGRPGWNVDDVVVQSCKIPVLFEDNFETGDVSGWDLTGP